MDLSRLSFTRKGKNMRSNKAEQVERLVPIPETAEFLGVSKWTIRKWVQIGAIASNKLGGRRLIPLSEIQRLIESTRIPARTEAA